MSSRTLLRRARQKRRSRAVELRLRMTARIHSSPPSHVCLSRPHALALLSRSAGSSARVVAGRHHAAVVLGGLTSSDSSSSAAVSPSDLAAASAGVIQLYNDGEDASAGPLLPPFTHGDKIQAVALGVPPIGF